MIELLSLVVAIVLVLICGLFVLAEFALVTVNRSKVETLAAKGDVQARLVLDALSTLSLQLSSAQVGITITNLAIGFLAEPAIASFLRAPLAFIGINEAVLAFISIIIGIAIATIITMIFGELVPKNIAIARPMDSAKLVVKFLLTFTRIIRLPLQAVNSSANYILSLFGVKTQEELASARSADEILSLVRRSADKGTLEQATAALLERSLTFGDQTAIDVMTPRVQVEMIQQDMTAEDLLAQARQSNTARFPVYDKSIDDITGIVHIKNALAVSPEKRTSTKIRSLMLKPVFVPATIDMEALLGSMRRSKMQLAIVIDEFGGMDGIVTLEDLLEELVGEVRDEHDTAEISVIREKVNRYRVAGRLRPDEVAEKLGIFLPDDDDFETLAGLFIHEYEKIPSVGDTVTVQAVDEDGDKLDVIMTVYKMDGNRVDWLRLSLPPSRKKRRLGDSV